MRNYSWDTETCSKITQKKKRITQSVYSRKDAWKNSLYNKFFFSLMCCSSITSQTAPVLFSKTKFLVESAVNMKMFPKIYDSMKLGFWGKSWFFYLIKEKNLIITFKTSRDVHSLLAMNVEDFRGQRYDYL